MTESPTYDVFISYTEADQAWVEGYLLDVLKQAGVRYHSEAAFALGKPRLSEFEHAIQHSWRILLVLSPAYLADNISEFVDLLAQSYGVETNSWPVIPLILHSVKLPPRLAMLTTLNATESARWPAAIERLCAELQRPVPGPAPRPPCPYPGMMPFQEDDHERFFGRDREVQELLERLRLHPFLTVIGPSGSGKSSLVFAGLIPALRQSGLFGPGEWLVQVVRPGESPLDALTGALHGDLTDPARTVSELLAARSNARRLLLVIDQFEELFTQARSDIEPFQQVLLRLIQVPHCYVLLTVRADFYPDLMATPLWREIQAHRIEVLPLDKDGLGQAIVRPAQSVGVFVEDGLVERLLADAIGEPGVLPLVQETLVLLWERLEQRFLPLHAYEALGGPGRTGLQVAMARRADAALADLTPVQQAMARRVFLRLVQFGEGRADTRRQQSVAALRAAGDDSMVFDQTLRHLADLRLLTLSGEEMRVDQRADIAHEALIAGWPTVQGWIAQRREAEQTRRQLEAKAVEWVRLGGGSGGLLDEVELAEAERWLSSPDATDLGYTTALAALAQDSRAALLQFQAEKEAARQRELKLAQEKAEAEKRRAEEQVLAAGHLRARNRIITVVGALALIAAVVAGVLGWRSEWNAGQARSSAATAEAASTRAVAQQATAVAERDRAEAQSRIALSRQLAAQAMSHVQDQFDLSALLSMEAMTVADTVEARSVLLTGLQAHPQLVQYLRGHTNSVSSVAFSPDGKTFASGDRDTTIILWDVATGQPLGQPLKGHTDAVWSVAFSPDGKTLASGSTDTTIILWDVATRQPLGQPLKGHTDVAWSVAFSPDGKALASGSRDKTLILWDVATRQPLGQSLKGHTDEVRSVAFSPDGRALTSGSWDGTIILWDVSNPAKGSQPLGQPLKGHTAPVESVAFSPDGKTLASGSLDKTIILWNVADSARGGQPLGQPLKGHTGAVGSVAFSPDGKTLASGSCGEIKEYSCTRGEIVLWDVAARQPLGQPLKGHTASVSSVAFSPDGKTLTSSGDTTIILWDVATRQPLGSPLTGHTSYVHSVAFSPAGKTLASGSADNTIILWDVASPAKGSQPLGQPLKGHTDFVESVAFSPDGKTLASGSYDGAIILWDVSVESWQARACRIANRNLTRAEWARYLPGEPYHKTCPDLPEGQ